MEGYFKTLAARLLERYGVTVVWDLHLQAAALHRRGNWAAALAMIGIADAAERRLSRPSAESPSGPAAAPDASGTPNKRRPLRHRFQLNGDGLGRKRRRNKRLK